MKITDGFKFGLGFTLALITTATIFYGIIFIFIQLVIK